MVFFSILLVGASLAIYVQTQVSGTIREASVCRGQRKGQVLIRGWIC
jgi:hypothetical protein